MDSVVKMSRDELIQQINQAARTGEVTLELRNADITELPESIGQLTSLQRLVISNNQLTELPESIGQLTNLQSLILFNNQLTILPAGIGYLTNLRTLNLGSNELTVLPESISQLTNLQKLDISNNQLTSVPEWIATLARLNELNFSGNQLTALPESISQLTNLQKLDLGHNQLSTLPEAIRWLISLEELNLDTNKLAFLPEWIGQFTKLTTLFLFGNQLTRLPESIAALANLRELDLENNRLISLPASLAQMNKLKRLKLDHNPLNPALYSAYSAGLNELQIYLGSLEEMVELLYEAKLMLVGEGGVGKTTLLKALTSRAPWADEPTTHGMQIDIQALAIAHPTKENVKIVFNAWDFGGQEIYRFTHQFFFSHRSIYLLVWEPRLGVQQSKIEDWLRLLRMRAGDARIIIVSTHCRTSQGLARIDKSVILRDFGAMIVGFHEVDNLVDDPETGEKVGIAELKIMIAEAAKDLEHMGMLFNRDWREARDELLAQREPHVDFEEFVAICVKHNLDVTSAKTLAILMHNLGYIVYYGYDERLKNIVILQPAWLAKGIGLVLEDRTTKEMDGILPDSRLREIWLDHTFRNEPKYEPELYPFFLRLMEQYGILYRLETGDASLVVQQVPHMRPQLPWLPEDEPLPGQRRASLVCIMDEVPPGLVPWMIVRTHQYAYDLPFADGKMHRLHWQEGMFLHNKRAGEAMLELRDREFHVYVQAVWPEYFMNVLQQTLQTLITDTWPGLQDRYVFTVPCPAKPNGKECTSRFRIDVLREDLNDGNETIRCNICRTRQNIVELLYGFENEDTREQLARVEQKIDQGFANIQHGFAELESRLANYVMTLLQEIASESKDGPRLFMLAPEDGNWRRPFQQRYRLYVWCEAEGCQHPVDEPDRGMYLFDATREWVQRVAPYANFIAGVLKTLLPMIAPALNLYFGAPKVESWQIKDSLDLAKEGTDKLLHDIETSASARVRQGVLSEAERSGVLALHAQLRELDPLHQRLGLRRVATHTGDYLWLCQTHYEQSQPKIPDRIDGFETVDDVIFVYFKSDANHVDSLRKLLHARGIEVEKNSDIEAELLSGPKLPNETIVRINRAKTVAIFIGEDSRHRWQDAQIVNSIEQLATYKSSIVIIKLPGLGEEPELPNLASNVRVDLNKGFRKSQLDEWEFFITENRPFETKGLSWIDWIYGEGKDDHFKVIRPNEINLSVGPTALRLRNIRSFEDTGVIHLSKQNTSEQLTLLLGDNAAGKSTLLQCIALAALGNQKANTAGKEPASFLRHGTKIGYIEVLFQLKTTEDMLLVEDTFLVGIEIEEGQNSFKPMQDNLSLATWNGVERLNILRTRTDDNFGFICGYGPWRTLANDPDSPWTEAENPVVDRVKSLFTSDYVLGHPDVMGKMLSGDFSNFRSAPKVLLDKSILENMNNHLCQLLPGIARTQETGEYNVSISGIPISIRNLSDGYSSMMAVIGHLFYHSFKRNNWQGDPTNIRGTLLIDEIDLHLHPSWQRHILPNLQEMFPDLQIIASSHSPMIAGSVSTECIVVLRPEPNYTKVIHDLTSVDGWRADQILTSVLFDLPTSRDVRTEKLLEEYAQKLNDRGPEDEEVQSLGRQVSSVLALEGEGVVDKTTHDLLNELLMQKFKSLDENTRKAVLAKAGLMIAE